MLTAPLRPRAARPHWAYTVRQWLWAGVDVLFPPRCGGCARSGQRFCARCRAGLAWLAAPVCEACGYPLEAGGRCLNHHPDMRSLTGLRSAAFFEGPLQHALHRLKYSRDMILADTLAEVLAEAWLRLALPGEIVVPVPLSSERLRERGYNQAALLARGFAELIALPCRPGALRRVRHTRTQVGLSVNERQSNVQAAFRADAPAVRGRACVLIDDVCTTGATLAACAAALAQAGATQVWGFTLGRARAVRTGAATQPPLEVV
jgi:ComF family protein